MLLRIDIEHFISFCETYHYDLYSGDNLSLMYINDNPSTQIDFSSYENLKASKQTGYYYHNSVIEHLVNLGSVPNCKWLKHYYLNMLTYVAQYNNISTKTKTIGDLAPEKGYRMNHLSTSFGPQTQEFLSTYCNECINVDKCTFLSEYRCGKPLPAIYSEIAEIYYEIRGVLNFQLFTNYYLEIDLNIDEDGVLLNHCVLINKNYNYDRKNINIHIARFKWQQLIVVSLFMYVSHLIITDEGVVLESSLRDVYQYPNIFYKVFKNHHNLFNRDLIALIKNIDEYSDYIDSTEDEIDLKYY